MQKTYITVRDVLKTAQKAHEEVQNKITRHYETDTSNRAQVLLNYLQREQGQIAGALAHFDENERDAILDTWLQYGPEPWKPSVPEIDKLGPDASLEKIFQLAIAVDDAFARFYADTAPLVKLPQARELFKKLSQQREAGKEKMAKQASALEHNE